MTHFMLYVTSRAGCISVLNRVATPFLPPRAYLFSNLSVRRRRNRARIDIDTPEDPRDSLPAFMSTPVQKLGGGNRDGDHRKKMRGLPKDSPEVRLSKTLSWILRHGAKSEGIPMRPDGYVIVTDLVSCYLF